MKRPAVPLQWLLAAAACTAATLACLGLDGRMSVAGLAMVYLVAVVAVALVLDRGPSLVASLGCVCALNFFFVPPRYTFRVDDPEYWWTLTVLLGLSVAVNKLIGSLRAQGAQARQGEAWAAQLHSLAEALAQCKGHEALAQGAARWMHQNLGLPCAVFLRAGSDEEPACWAAGSQEAGFDRAAARWALDHRRPLGRGCDDWTDLPLWCAPFAPSATAGAVQLLLPGRDKPAAGVQQRWLTLVRQVGLAIDRERASALAQAAQDSARAESARNTLLASLSHDLRTPLAGILGSASALRAQGDGMSAAQRDKLLANLENEARDMTLMADNILQMARLSQPHSQLKTQWESIEDVLGAALARMRRRWPQARFELHVTPQLPPVRAEAGLLAQLVSNLVDNAVRHGGGHPEVILRAGRSREGVFVAVRDHGSGLPSGDPQALFERYGQRARDGSSGLGLAICQMIVQAHGGRIEARRCTPGTEFRIDLPVPQQERANG